MWEVSAGDGSVEFEINFVEYVEKPKSMWEVISPYACRNSEICFLDVLPTYETSDVGMFASLVISLSLSILYLVIKKDWNTT